MGEHICEYIAYSLLVPDTARILYGGMDINRQLEETMEY